MALTPVQQEKVSTDFMYLRDKAIIETISEKKRVVLRNVKKQPGRAVELQLTYGLRSDQSLFGELQGSDFS